MISDDMELVRHYAAHQSESALAALVSRHARTWTSKLGNLADVEHSLLSSLEDAGLKLDDYGKVTKFLKRPATQH